MTEKGEGVHSMSSPTNWDELPLVLNAEQVAKLLGIGRRSVYEAVKIPGFPVVHVGRAVRVPRDALRRWLESRAAKARNAV